MKKDKVSIILVFFFFVGVCVFLYPALSQYWNSKTQTQAVADYQSVIKALTPADYSAMFDAADDYNKRLNETAFPLTQYKDVEGYDSTLDISGTGIMGYVTIDKINIELPIYHGTSDQVLSMAVGHVEGTSLPVGGKSTHSVLSAHRGLPNSRLFTDLDKIEVGDVFTITILNKLFTYQVDQIKTVTPSQLEDIYVTDGMDYCTLLTCTPYGINSHRLLVRGVRIENTRTMTYITSDAFLIDPIVATPAVAAPMLFVLFIYLMVRYRKKKKPDSPNENQTENTGPDDNNENVKGDTI